MSRLMQQLRDQEFDKKSSKPARTCRKPGCKPSRKPGLQPGLQLARIMECGLYAKATQAASAIGNLCAHSDFLTTRRRVA